MLFLIPLLFPPVRRFPCGISRKRARKPAGSDFITQSVFAPFKSFPVTYFLILRTLQFLTPQPEFWAILRNTSRTVLLWTRSLRMQWYPAAYSNTLSHSVLHMDPCSEGTRYRTPADLTSDIPDLRSRHDFV